MAKEIERKFLVVNKDWKNQVSNFYTIKQAYLLVETNKTIRIRITDQSAFITIKAKTESVISRLEFEYEIPKSDALEMLKLSEYTVIEKTRYEVFYENKLWEIDVFEGENQGLIVAEIELNAEEESFEKPAWLGKEVTFEDKYLNANLISFPFKEW